MKKLFLITIILLLQSLPSYGKVGDGYVCKPKQHLWSYEKEFRIIDPKELQTPFYEQKFVWMESNIKFNELNLSLPIETHLPKGEYFKSYDGFNKVTYDNGFLIWTQNSQFPTTGFSVKTFNCQKF